jgi:hypothetical protein
LENQRGSTDRNINSAEIFSSSTKLAKNRKGNTMGKILKVKKDGDQVVMTVLLESGSKEKWTYEREETSAGFSYLQVSREDAR